MKNAYPAGEEIVGALKTVRNDPEAKAMHNDSLAKRAGFKGAIVLNEYHFAQISQMLLEYFGPQWLSHGEIEIKYIAPLHDQDLFVPKATIVGEDPPDSGRLALEIWCENQDGEKLAFGKASCLVREQRATV
ncbi:MAG: hypothetical protein V3S89_03330 [Desulfobacterales bacterium]